MLWVFSGAGLAGVLCGCLFRAPAVLFLSFAIYGCAFVISVLSGPSLGSAIVTAFLASAALQMAYVVGIGLRYFWDHVGRRLSDLSDGFEFESLWGVLSKARLRATDQRQKLRNLAG
jgi:hypothetical protein